MSVINIRRDVSDKFYRYKMPKLISKIEGKGNGIKTVIVNMSEIAKALSRPPAYPTKYFGFELGTQVKLDEKNDRYVINGAHNADSLQDILDGFIDKFVLCASCKNPETEFTFTKDDILKDCKACGAHLPVDMRHKLTSYIMKNKPAEKKDKYSKVKDKAADAEEEGMQVDDELEKELAALPTAEQHGVDDDWAVDTSADAVAARVKDLGISESALDGDLKDPVEEFADFLTPDLSDEDIIAKAEELEVREDKVCAVLPQVFLNEKVLQDKQIEARLNLFKAFLKNEKCQKGLLGGIERLVGINHPELLPRVSLIFKVLYFEDLVDEEVFLSWSEKASKKYVDKKISVKIREAAAPFITWLKEAEEEE
ncbi:hypothetical protein HK103_000135 [Boothiomyces macroporosus]|uniref:W2 domain-containing protein n=1 Tax=Boothiomyces macroporosus TaxID=261099 RepID=A0AAD5URZ8_9FUNG|nr:hypothetical protein HK103_000135 [Boothiomyces macroporosus]